VLFGSRVRVRIRFYVWLVVIHTTVLSIVIVTLPKLSPTPFLNLRKVVPSSYLVVLFAVM